MQIAESDLAAQARVQAAQLGQTASTQLTRFVEGSSSSANSRTGSGAALDDGKRDFWDSFGEPPKGPSKNKQEFWDHFGGADEPGAVQSKPASKASIGTAAMRKGGGASAVESRSTSKADDAWADW